jgi:hypothetical protein
MERLTCTAVRTSLALYEQLIINARQALTIDCDPRSIDEWEASVTRCQSGIEQCAEFLLKYCEEGRDGPGIY